MNHRDLVHHGLAIKRHATAEAVAELVGLPGTRVAALLAEAVATQRAVEVKGAYALAPLARIALESRYDLYFEALRQEPAFVAAYEEFERINRSLKAVITDWQTVEIGGTRLANDHRDASYDAAVMDRLATVHDRVESVLRRLAAHVPRLANYETLLLTALEAAEDGEGAWVSDVRRASYHTVWFELHEDLLRLMGRQRDE